MGKNTSRNVGDLEQEASTGTGQEVTPDEAPAALAPDEFHGQGGLYEMRHGRRVLVERTAPESTSNEPKGAS